MKFSYEGEKSQWKIGSLILFGLMMVMLTGPGSVAETLAQTAKPEGWHRLRTNSVPYQPRHVALDAHGGLWVSAIDGTEYEPGLWYRPAGGSFQYWTPDRRNNAVSAAYNPPVVKPELNTTVLYAVRDKGGNTWYALKNRKVLCEKADGTWLTYNMPDSSDVQPGTDTTNVDSAHRIRLIDKQDGTQEKLLIAYRGVVRVDAGFTVVETRKVYQYYNNYFIRDVLIDSQGRYWVTSEMGLEKGTSLVDKTYVKDLYPSGQYPAAPGASTVITRIVEDVSGNIWFGSESGYGADGIYRFTGTGEWVKYATGVVNDIGKTVHDIAPASDGSVWFGAYYSGNGGLLRYTPTGGGLWTRYRGTDLGLDSEEVPSLVSDGQGLWFASAYTPTVTGNGTGVHYLTLNDQGEPNVTHYTYRGSSTTLTSLRFNYIAADRSGGVWFPAYDDPSIARLKADGTWQQFRQAGNGSWGSGGFAGVAADSQNRVYFAPTNSPPVAYDVSAEQWVNLPATSFTEYYYYGVYIDPQDGKWFHGAGFVYYLDPDNTEWTSYNTSDITPQFPANYYVDGVLVDDAGNVWFMTWSGIVLLKKNPEGGPPVWFKFTSGSSGYTGGYRVYQDDNGQIWNAAKQKFDPQSNSWLAVTSDTSAFDHRQLRFLNGRVQADWDLSGALPPITGLDERNMTVDSRGTIYFTGWLGNVNAGIVAFGMQNGDMDRNGRVDLADALLVAKVLIGQPSAVFSGSSIDGDGKIGLAEMIFVLQSLAGLRTGQTGGTLRGTLALPSGIEGVASNNVLVQLEGTSFSATPGNDGSFTISNIPAGNYSLLVESGENQAYKYRATFTITNGKTINTGNIDLLKTGTISGSATLENVFDHAGVDVYLAGTSFLARTAGDGSYRIYYVPPGFYTLIAAYPGYQRVVIEGIEVKAGEDTLVKPILLKKETLTVGAVYGRVYTDDAGGVRRPLAGANVSLFMPWTMGTSLRPGPNFATSTDDNGYFLLQDIPAGLYVIQVIADGYRPEKREIAVKGGENLSLEFSLAAAVTGTGDIAGYVVEDTGMLTLWKPLGGARVSLLASGGTVTFTLTEGDGSFKFSGIAGGAYELQAGKEGYRPERVPVTVVPGQTGNMTIRLAPVLPPGELGNISGFVKDTAGNGLPGAKVLATRAMMGISIEKPYIYETVAGEDGNFSIELMPPGIYKLLFAKEGFQMASLPVEVKSGETSSVHAVLKPIVTTTGSIAGTVVDNAGNPVPEVAITVEIPISCAQLSIIGCGHPVFRTLSDENGNFELANLPALEGYVLTAQKTGYEKVVITSVNVAAGGVTRADITLQALDSGVELILTDTDGKPLPGMMARVSGPDSELYRLTDQSGKVVFYLKPDEYLLTAPVENYYRIMGDVVMEDGTIAGSSLGMPICYPDYAGCFNFGQNFIPHSEKANVNQGEFVKTTFRIERFLLEPAEGAVTNDPLPTFSWNPYPKAASYTMRVHDNAAMQIMWQATLAETTAVYNYDGTGRPLLPGGRYSWQITTDTGVQSNRRSFTTTAADTTGTIVP